MNLSWYVRRLSRMSAGEIVRRARDRTLQSRWRRRRVKDAALDPLAVPDRVPRFVSVLDPALRDGISPDARSRLLSAADRLLSGRWRVFDREVPLGEAPDWFLDARSGLHAPRDVYAFDIPHRDETRVGNVKYVWELSRHHHLTVLAAAFFLTRDERYAQTAARHLESWWRDNPFLSGVHWTSGIEIGLRLISLVWIRRLLEGWSGAERLFETNRLFLQQLHHHQEYLAAFPSYGSSANNHRIAEAAGQFAASCGFPYFPEAEGWRSRASQVLRQEIQRQTFSSGVNRELATDYHGFVLELCLDAAIEGEIAGHSLGDGTWEVIGRMMDALAGVVDTLGRPPRQGDGDNGLGLLVDGPDFDRWASLLATGERLFGAPAWWPVTVGGDVRSALWSALMPSRRGSGSRPQNRPHLWPDAGIVILRDRTGPEEIWCRCDHGPHGFLATAAHAHADALAIEVRVGGIDVLADPGTYCYHGEPAWRRYIQSTLAHNTLELDGRDQSVRGGPFLWTRQARSRLDRVEGLDGGPVALWCASHDGYARRRPPAIHRRSVRLLRAERRIVIEDRVESQNDHLCRQTFHLGPIVTCLLDGNEASLEWSDGTTRRRARLALARELTWECVKGLTKPPFGWFSPSFGQKVPAAALIGTGTIDQGMALVTELAIDPIV
jgi:hypothetical protein